MFDFDNTLYVQHPVRTFHWAEAARESEIVGDMDLIRGESASIWLNRPGQKMNQIIHHIEVVNLPGKWPECTTMTVLMIYGTIVASIALMAQKNEVTNRHDMEERKKKDGEGWAEEM